MMKRRMFEIHGRKATWSLMLPCKAVVCWRCDGDGSHTNPSIDGNGLTQEDFDSDPEFAENYFSGVYDIQCSKCKGERVLWEVEMERLSKREKILWDNRVRLLEQNRDDYHEY